MAEYLKIPEDRIGALVGKEGKTRATIEKRCKVKMIIGENGGVNIESKDEDGLAEWKARDIAKAIGRGFNPKYAMLLLKDGYGLSIIDLYKILKGKDSEMRRVKSRIIGEKGKAWRAIELLTSTRIAVYGKTVSIIGADDDVELCERALDMIIAGSRHQNVYRFLEAEGNRIKGI
jgi:ribosomal RNA assembly protein